MTADVVSLESLIQAFGHDRWSSAHMLALHSLKILERVTARTRSLSPQAGRGLFKRTVNQLIAGQPAMAIVLNAVGQVEHAASGVKEGWQDAAADVIAELKEQIADAPAHIGKHAARLIAPKATIMALSYSSIILRVVKELQEHGKRPSLVILESRPLLEARRLATAAARLGVSVTLFVDAAVQESITRSDLVLLGADAILRDGSVVHKVGSYPVALAAHEGKKPIYVACESLKVLRKEDERLVWNRPREAGHVWRHPPTGVQIENILFDRVPGRLISMYITEHGAARKPLTAAPPRRLEKPKREEGGRSAARAIKKPCPSEDAASGGR